MKITKTHLREMIKQQLEERCQKGYKTHPTRKTKKMFGRTYRNCVKAEAVVNEENAPADQKALADDMELLLKKLLDPAVQQELSKHMHPDFIADLQGRVQQFKMDVYGAQIGKYK